MKRLAHGLYIVAYDAVLIGGAITAWLDGRWWVMALGVLIGAVAMVFVLSTLYWIALGWEADGQ
jgi:hypothetical protein